MDTGGSDWLISDRLEASRKYLFGSVGVLGTPNNSIIEGVFIARGKDIKPVVEVAPDWESYSFAPIDLSDPAQKVFFEGALAWDLEVDGKKWADGKNVSTSSRLSHFFGANCCDPVQVDDVPLSYVC